MFENFQEAGAGGDELLKRQGMVMDTRDKLSVSTQEHQKINYSKFLWGMVLCADIVF